MNILLTGAFGNIGLHTIKSLLGKGHRIRCFDLPTRTNQTTAEKFSGQVEMEWGDLRDPTAVKKAQYNQEAIIHLGFVIPTLSATGVGCEEKPEWAETINVGGTRNLIEAAQQSTNPPNFIFASSLHVYGRTQDQLPPRKVSDSVQPVEHYAKHKVICESMLKESSLAWSIFRLPATLPIRLILDRGMFDVPLNNRIEYGHGADVGDAFANGIECREVLGKTLLIGGGKRCQYYYRDIVKGVMETIGLGMISEQAFSQVPFSTDWLDTDESERLLHYQKRTLKEYLLDIREVLGWKRRFVKVLSPIIRAWLVSHSPYYQPAFR